MGMEKETRDWQWTFGSWCCGWHSLGKTNSLHDGEKEY